MTEELNLVFERKISHSIEKLWTGWTDPQTLMKWFCPRPWKVVECRIDLKPGGEFFTVMQSPEGESFPNNGSFLEVIPKRKLVWTNMMSKNFTPILDEKMGFPFTVILTMDEVDGFVHYKAVVKHANLEGKKKHEQMGFQEGWGLAFDQLLEI